MMKVPEVQAAMERTGRDDAWHQHEECLSAAQTECFPKYPSARRNLPNPENCF